MLGAAQVTKGRPRKPNVLRDRSGKSRGEPEVVDATRLDYRVRDLRRAGLKEQDAIENANSALAGFTLGVLLLRHQVNCNDPDSIHPAQYRAGHSFARIVREHARITGYSLSRPRSPSFVMVSFGVSCADPPSAEEVAKIRDDYRLCYDGLAAASKDHGPNVQYATYAVCVENRPISALTTADYGALRIGLNVLARALR